MNLEKGSGNESPWEIKIFEAVQTNATYEDFIQMMTGDFPKNAAGFRSLFGNFTPTIFREDGGKLINICALTAEMEGRIQKNTSRTRDEWNALLDSFLANDQILDSDDRLKAAMRKIIFVRQYVEVKKQAIDEIADVPYEECQRRFELDDKTICEWLYQSVRGLMLEHEYTYKHLYQLS